jgi:type IV pilus assembly protein PilO
VAKAPAKKQTKGSDFFTSVAKLKGGAKAGILLGTLTLLGIGFYFLVFTPWSEKIVALTLEEAQLQEQVKNEQTTLAKNKPINEYIEPVKFTYDYLKNYLTSENEIPKLIQIISDLGAQAGARVTLFAPKPAVTHPTFAEIQFTMNLEGSFLNVLKFFYSLSQMDRLIYITSVTIDSPKMADNRTMVVNVKCQGSTYRVLTPDEVKKAAESSDSKKK